MFGHCQKLCESHLAVYFARGVEGHCQELRVGHCHNL